jgi:monofunctional biosynthetic peptidoglycan transglycosylase
MIKTLKFVFAAVFMLGVAAALYLASFFFWPNVEELAKKNPEKTAFMEYRENQWEREGRNVKIIRTWVPLPEISPYLRKAVVISEDDAFWSHEGFDYTAIRSAVETDIRARKFKFGASTITQQLAKNLYMSPSKNPVRKAAEAILTRRIEKALSKRRILEIYLNIVEWGDGVFGAEAAARHYFGKPASALSPEESARLAIILPSPLRLNPLKNSGYVPRRAKAMLDAMAKRGDIKDSE